MTPSGKVITTKRDPALTKATFPLTEVPGVTIMAGLLVAVWDASAVGVSAPAFLDFPAQPPTTSPQSPSIRASRMPVLVTPGAAVSQKNSLPEQKITQRRGPWM